MILITGCAGFIGFNLVLSLSKSHSNIVGIDNISLNSSLLQNDRLKKLQKIKNFKYINFDISNKLKVNNFFKANKIKVVIHLAALAGVRDSIKNPNKYFSTNIAGFFNMIEASKNNNIKKFIYASSSSVYDEKAKIPYSENDSSESQISFYALSKKTNEQVAKFYSNTYGIQTIGLRFFSVYGPWGRPDMAYYIFTDKIYRNKTIEVFNNGNHSRDFTYVDDVTNFIKLLISKTGIKKFEIYNVGNSSPISLKKLISSIEKKIQRKAKIRMMGRQIGDVDVTFANMKKSKQELNFETKTPFEEGIQKFVDWYTKYTKN